VRLLGVDLLPRDRLEVELLAADLLEKDLERRVMLGLLLAVGVARVRLAAD